MAKSLGGLLAAVGLLALLGCASAQYCSKSFEVMETYGKFFFTGSEKMVAGTVYYFKDHLKNTSGSTEIGTVTGLCAAGERLPDYPESGFSYCNEDIFIEGFGAISLQGEFQDIPDATFKMSIVGGTGKYKGLSGVATVTVPKVGEAWKYSIMFTTKPPC